MAENRRLTAMSTALLALSVVASAQNPPTAKPAPGKPAPAKPADAKKEPEKKPVPDAALEIGGKTYLEQIFVNNGSPSIPLRFGSVKRGSERVEFNGRTLVRDVDYSIDYVAGAVFLRVPVQSGQSVRVHYRYDEAKGAQGTFALGSGTADSKGFSGYKFDLAPGAGAYVGLGFTERTGDGTVISSNVYGITNAFSLAPGASISGLFMVGDRQKSSSLDLMGRGGQGSKVEEGTGRALIQKLQSQLFGGTVSAYYQDVDKKFAGFQSFQSAGYSQAQIDQISREKGLKRTSLGLQNIGGKVNNFSQGFNSIGDENGSIVARTGGLSLFGIKSNWWSQEVDRGFTRFQDTGAQDWQQLGKEKGLTRKGSSVQYGSDKTWLASFNSLALDSDRGSLNRQSIGLKTQEFKFDFSSQKVDRDFVRFGDVRPNEWNGGQLAQEKGFVRESLDFTSKRGFSYSSDVVRSDSGRMKDLDVGYRDKKFSLEHSLLDFDAGFNRIPNVGEPQIQETIKKAAQMSNPAANPQGHDRGAFFNSAGIARSTWKLGYDLGRGAKAAIQTLKIQGKKDALKSNAASLVAKNFRVRWSDQKTGAGFSEVNRLMPTEQQVLGARADFEKKDFDLSANLGGKKQLEIDVMSAKDATGGARRSKIDFTDKDFKLNWASRGIDSGFIGLQSLADPERDYLRSLAGFELTEGALAWNIMPNLSVDSQLFSAKNDVKDIDREYFRSRMKWNASKNTSFETSYNEHKIIGDEGDLINQRAQSIRMNQALGRLGKITFVTESQTFDGKDDRQLDADTKTVIFETKLNKKTDLRTEQSQTIFEDGTRKTINSNTLSTEISPRAGVTVTETLTNSDGDESDKTQRNYGFWYDFGKGIRFKYGYARNLNGTGDDTLQSGTELTGGVFQGVKVDSAVYQRNAVDEKRQNHIGRVSLGNAKPMNWGWLNDVRFHYLADTVRDWGVWHKEYRTFGFGATKGKIAFSFDYQSQAAPGGDRAIDRTFSFNSDKSGKAKLQASMKYGVRTMPNSQNVMIRDYRFSWKPNSRLSLDHAVVTNELRQQNGALLGTLAQPFRTNTWSLNYTKDRNLEAGLFWKENLDESRKLMTREGGVDMKIFASSASPFRLTYGVAQIDQKGARQTAHKFGFIFNQRPGPNQTFNFILENLNWQHGRPDGSQLQNWNLRLDYSLRF